VLVAVTFNVHPGAGVIAGTAVGVVLLTLVPRQRWRTLALPAAVGAAIALPNVIEILRNAPIGGTGAEFLATFHDYSVHVYPRAHWRENYAFFAVLLAVGTWGTAALPERARRGARALVLAMVALIALYAVNAATVEVVPVLLLYLYRATWVLKPVLVGCACAGIAAWLVNAAAPARPVKLVLAGIAAVALIVQYDVLADGLAAFAVGTALVVGALRPPSRAIGLVLASAGALLAALALGVPIATDVRSVAGALQLVIISAALMAFLAPPSLPTALARSTRDSFLRPALAALAFIAIAPLVLPRSPGRPRPPWQLAVVLDRFRFLHPHQSVAGLYEWVVASTPAGAFFVTPSNDSRFAPFRALTGRGQYVTVPDINQLAYDPPSYRRAADRLQITGVRVLGPGVIDGQAYASLSDDALRTIAADGVTHAIVPIAAIALPRPFRELYRDRSWAVLELKPSVTRDSVVGGTTPSPR
ncbi:MAG: hypothetical protein O2973_14095, partial [Gemmatimonadetes bacterium]|nr:hypothetical protein [Gemmatimonadota bacterium]